MGKKFSIRKPRVRLTKEGLKIQGPSARIGGKAGINISKSGVSGSVRTKKGSYNTKRGFSFGCVLPIVVLMMLVLAVGVLIVG